MTATAEKTQPLLTVADEAMAWVKKELPKGCEAEIFLSRGKERGIEMRDGRLETLQESQDEGIGLRILQEGRMGFAYAAGRNDSDLERIFRQVIEQLPHVPPDRFRAFAAPAAGFEPDPALSKSMSDQSLFVQPLQDQLAPLKEMQSKALALNSKVQKVLRLGYGESWSEVVVMNTLGVRATEGGTHCSVGLATVGQSADQIQVGSGSKSARFYSELNFSDVAKESVFRTAALLDSKKLPTKRRAVIFDPWVSGEFLDLIAGAMCADQVQRGKSLFRDKMGKKIGSPLVTLIDDPHRLRAIASASFDDEGVPTQRKTMAEKGVLKEFFYDTYTARKENRASNGAGGRASYKGVPSPSSSNFFLEKGLISREKLLGDTQDGILVLEVMGMHTADTITGEFSVGISGVAVENGRLTHGVRGAMLAGNILDILERIDAVADDLTFYGRIGAPTFRVSDLTVA